MTLALTPKELTDRLHAAMAAAVGLTPTDISNVQSLIDASEWLVAFEMLCTQIYEWEIELQPEVIQDLERLGAVLGARLQLTANLWEDASGA